MRFIPAEQTRQLVPPAQVRQLVKEAFQQQHAGSLSLSDQRVTDVVQQRWRYRIKGAVDTNRGYVALRLSGIGPSGSGDLPAVVRPVGGAPMRYLLLNDARNMAPLAILEESYIYAQRVGAVVAVAAPHLVNAGPQVVALIGAGKLAEAVLTQLAKTVALKEVKVTSRTATGRESFAREMADRHGLPVQACPTAKDACEGASIVITITTADAPLVDGDWLAEGCTVFSLGGKRELAQNVLSRSDQIFVDDWLECMDRGDLAAWVHEGILTQEQVTGALGAVISGALPGRRSIRDRILVVPQGIALLDMYVAIAAYELAVKTGTGSQIEPGRE